MLSFPLALLLWEVLNSLWGYEADVCVGGKMQDGTALKRCCPGCVLQDFLFTYRDRVEAVTAQQVVEAAARHLHPQQQVVVVVGDAAVFGPQLIEAGFEVQALRPTPAE